MKVIEVDVDNDAAFNTWYRPIAAAQLADWPEQFGWRRNDLRALLRRTDEASELIVSAVAHSGEGIGSARVSLPLLDNPHVAWIDVTVDPVHRGEGVGRALLARAEEIARANGRSNFMGRTQERSTGPKRFVRFVEAAGYRAANLEMRRELQLPISLKRRSELEEEVAQSEGNFEVVPWVSNCPERLVEGRAHLEHVFSADMPLGDLKVEAHEWNVSRFRGWEDSIAATNRLLIGACAVLQGTSEVIGFSEMVVPKKDPKLAWQFATVVDRAYRGHRLGLQLKLATITLLEKQSPLTARITTRTAIDNSPMNRVNDQLGFEIVSFITAWQRHP